MKKVVLKRTDEAYPNAVNGAAEAVVSFLLNHDIYVVPFCEILTNIPLNFTGNRKFMYELENYFKTTFKLYRYYIGDDYKENEIKMLVGLLTSYFTFYDDVEFHAFIQRNSRYSNRKKDETEELQRKAFGCLKGYVFEQLICKLLSASYQENDCMFENGCVVEIDDKIVQVKHDGIPRKTIDFAGIDKRKQSGDFVECKVQPIRIDEVTVKYIKYLYEEMKAAGYINIKTGFVTAGSQEAVRERIAESLGVLMMCDPGITIYDIEKLRTHLDNEAV